MEDGNGKAIISKFLRGKTTLGLLILVLVFTGYFVYRERQGQREEAQNVKSLEGQIAKMEKDNLDLGALVKYLRSNDFVEKEAREKLNMQMPGEQVVVMSEKKVNGASTIGESQENKENWELWWEYFFN
jgi:cell division protein FtsB